jgi:hypothetical protein
MSQSTTDLKNDIQKSLDHMRTLRDEIRVKIHLAGMDVKDEWNHLEPQLEQVERAASEFSEATRHAVSETVKRLTKLRSSLS